MIPLKDDNPTEGRPVVTYFLIGLLLGLLLFPSPDFTQSILIGTFLSRDLFPPILSNYLLFWSFLLATLSPVIAIISYDSFKR